MHSRVPPPFATTPFSIFPQFSVCLASLQIKCNDNTGLKQIINFAHKTQSVARWWKKTSQDLNRNKSGVRGKNKWWGRGRKSGSETILFLLWFAISGKRVFHTLLHPVAGWAVRKKGFWALRLALRATCSAPCRREWNAPSSSRKWSFPGWFFHYFSQDCC